MKHVLNAGCGPRSPDKLNPLFRQEGWQEVRLDIDPAVEPDIVGSMTNLSMIPSAQFDAVWSAHNIEHLYDHEVNVALQEIFRILKPSGLLLMRLPDLQTMAEWIARGDIEKPLFHLEVNGVTVHQVTPLDVIYGCRYSIAHGRTYMAHRTGFTQATLSKKLSLCGFAHHLTARTSDGDLWALCAKQPDLLDERWFHQAIGVV